MTLLVQDKTDSGCFYGKLDPNSKSYSIVTYFPKILCCYLTVFQFLIIFWKRWYYTSKLCLTSFKKSQRECAEVKNLLLLGGFLICYVILFNPLTSRIFTVFATLEFIRVLHKGAWFCMDAPRYLGSERDIMQYYRIMRSLIVWYAIIIALHAIYYIWCNFVLM